MLHSVGKPMRFAAYPTLFLLFSASAFAQSTSYITGTGFVVSNEGYIVTNAHVVPACREVQVIQDNTSQTAAIVRTDMQHDLALLKVTGTMPNVGKLRSNPLTLNEAVVVVGHPRGGALTTADATLLKLTGPAGESGLIEFSSAAIQGNSGGPLLDTGGNIIGVVSAISTAVQYNTAAAREDVLGSSNVAISLDILRAFLSSGNVRYSEGVSAPGTLSADRVTDAAKAFVVKLHCLK